MKKILALILAIVSFIGIAFAAVNINTADQKQLESLRGIGPVRAKAIISYREKNGPFKTLEDVDKVPGIGKGTLEKIKDDVIFSGPTTSLGPDAKPEKTAQAETKKPSTKAETTTAAERKSKESEKKASEKKADEKPGTKNELVDVNHASQKDLEALPGVGEARAKAIIKGRPYKGKDDLVAKKVIPQNVYDDIKDRIIAKQK